MKRKKQGWERVRMELTYWLFWLPLHMAFVALLVRLHPRYQHLF